VPPLVSASGDDGSAACTKASVAIFAELSPVACVGAVGEPVRPPAHHRRIAEATIKNDFADPCVYPYLAGLSDLYEY
jgi:hypothetical protein